MLEFNLPIAGQPIIKVIGVGGGGSNAVNHMFKEGIVGVDFAICNTDHQALELSPIPNKIQLGPGLTEGRGAGSKPEVGKHACLESIEDIQQFLSHHTKMLFVTAGMGGGTGTGAAPIIAKAAREMGILTVGIVTLPFAFEGKVRLKYAHEGLDELKRNVDSIIIISNDKLREIHGNLAISAAFAEADNILTTAAKGIAEIITIAGYINVDFEDVNTVMRNSGVAIMGSAVADGEDRARRAVDMALNSPLLEDNNITGAQNVLLNITSGKREATMDEISEITEFVQEEAGIGTNIIWGNCYDESLGDKISVTVIASGFEKHNRINEGTATKTFINLESGNETVVSTSDLQEGMVTKPVYNENYNQPTHTGNEPTLHHDEPAYTNHVSKPTPDEVRQLFKRQVMKVKLSNPHTVSELENTPAYVRRQVALDDVPHSSERNYSRWSINGEDELVMPNDSPFLRDLADYNIWFISINTFPFQCELKVESGDSAMTMI